MLYALLRRADLRISEIVDMPNWGVSYYFPRYLFVTGPTGPSDFAFPHDVKLTVERSPNGAPNGLRLRQLQANSARRLPCGESARQSVNALSIMRCFPAPAQDRIGQHDLAGTELTGFEREMRNVLGGDIAMIVRSRFLAQR